MCEWMSTDGKFDTVLFNVHAPEVPIIGLWLAQIDNRANAGPALGKVLLGSCHLEVIDVDH